MPSSIHSYFWFQSIFSDPVNGRLFATAIAVNTKASLFPTKLRKTTVVFGLSISWYLE